MEKVSRSSGGGAAKLGTLDMQSYLEVMGRQLDEIQAQHQQFYASRPDRQGRLRSQDHPAHLAKRWSSESQCTQQPAGLSSGCHVPDEAHAQLASPPNEGGNGALRSSSHSQIGARRSLLFGGESYTTTPAGAVAVNSRTSPGKPTVAGVGPNSLGELRAIHSTPPPLAGMRTGAGGGSLTALGRSPRPASDRVLAYTVPQGISDSPSVSESTSITQSVTQSAASSNVQSEIPGTPSSHTGPKRATPPEASRLGTASSSRTSPARPYSVYDASGVGTYATPDSREDDYPLTASASSSSQAAWRKSRGPAVSPSPGLSVVHGRAASPSTASGEFSLLAGGGDLVAGAGHGEGSEDECSSYTLALAGRPFDGIDSEEDDEGQAGSVSRASGNAHTYGAGGLLGPAGATGGSAKRALQPDDDDGKQATLLQTALQPNVAGADSATRPQSRSGSRAPLVVASLETEEALRALLATPRVALSRSGTVGASMEGLEVPDDVLAALAKTDGMDLDAALGAAMAASLREHSAQEQQLGSPSARSAVQHQGLGGVAQTGHGRHMVLFPGALTAAPVAVPAVVAARGFDASVRSTGGTGGARTIGGAGAALPVGLSQREGVHLHQGERLAFPVDASIEVDRFDMLSRTIEVTTDDAGLCNSLSVAMAAQVTAAQQHSQPVLYSLAPKPSAASDKSSRRNTLDGDGRRGTMDGGGRHKTVDGGNRRNTADGDFALNDHLEDGHALGADQLRTRLLAAPAYAAAAVWEVRQSELRPVGASPGVGAAGAGHIAAAGSLPHGRPSEGFTASLSPVRGLRVGANTASPSASSALRPGGGGDGDMVLYGSPSQKADSGPSPSVAASPYVPPSPPLGADPTPYMASPMVLQLGSRLQRSSRNIDGEAVIALQRDAITDCGQAGQADAAGPSSAGVAALRPWSAAPGTQGSSRRQLTPTTAAGTPSGANSIHLDLSLTQAAAAAATGVVRPAALGSQPPSAAVSTAASPAISQRQLRAQGSQHLPVLHRQQPQQPEQQQVPPPLEVPQLPAYSSVSLVDLSPRPRSVAKVASHDLGVDEVGRPFPSLPSPKDAVAGASLAQGEPAGTSAEANRASKTQLQALGPPLAAFSRAAALAAAADVGMAVPPPAAERRPVPPVAPAAGMRVPLVDVVGRSAGGPPDSGSTARVLGTAGMHVKCGTEASDRSTAGTWEAFQPSVVPKGAGVLSTHEDDASDVRHDGHDHPELLQGQSPGPQCAAPSVAKLSQLKARRQQQWQSQHGLQGSQLPPSGAATPPPQQSGAAHYDEQSADAIRAAAHGWVARPGARLAPDANVAVSGASEAASAKSPLAAAVGSPLLPDAVAAAIVRAACSREEAVVSGKLNLGHGISGLSVAIEAGQVKWAWQTECNDKPSPGRLHTTTDAPPSPVAGSGGSSPWASPSAAQSVVRDSNSEWALQQLPAPQWQRHGQLPARAPANKEERGRQQLVDAREAALEPHQPSGNCTDTRRRSEYSPERQIAMAGAGALQHNYAISAGGFQTQEPHQPRIPSATDGGGQPNSKAMALLRLKQQSIMRHNVQVSSVKESGPEPEASQQQAQGSALQFQPYQLARASSAGAHQAGQQQLQHPQRHVSASRATHTGEMTESKQQASRQWTQDADDVGGENEAGPQAQAKPFLRRRSAKVQARKVDWSHVKPRTNSRNPDYYIDQNSPDAMLKGRGSPLSSPRGGISKPPLNVNVGARTKKPGAARPPLTPTGEDKAAVAAPARRRLSNIPPAPGPAPPAGGAVEARRGAGVGGVRGAGGALSPLDDLLAHVNTLLKDFDRIVL